MSKSNLRTYLGILALLLILLLSSTGIKADDPEKIPDNPNFPKAEYPYAQAPDGCSSISENPKQVRDTWPFPGYGDVSFKEACDKHDRCYYTLGASWQNCNEQYRIDLMEACWDDLSTRVENAWWLKPALGEYSTIPPDPATLASCEEIALTYYTAVQIGVALDVFNTAQKLQKDYEAYVASVRDNQNSPEIIEIDRRPGETAPIKTANAQGTVINVYDYLNVRDGPGTDYDPPIGRLSLNEKVRITGKNGDWWQIEIPNEKGRLGWVSGDYIDPENVSEVPFVDAPSPLQPPSSARNQPVFIVFKHSDSCLWVVDGSARFPEQVEQMTCPDTDRPEFHFTIEPVPGHSGYNYLRASHSKGCIGVEIVEKRNFGNGGVKHLPCEPTNKMMWRVVPSTRADARGWFQLKTKEEESYCLGVENRENYYSQPEARLEDKRVISTNQCYEDPWQLVEFRR